MIDAGQLNDGFRIGDWFVQPRLGTMSRQGRIEHPSRNALHVLMILASSEGRFVSRSELIERVWENPAIGNVPLNRCMHELSALFDDPSYIRNATGRGYRIGQAVIIDPVTATPSRHRVLRGAVVALAIAVVAMLLLLWAWLA
ncbi:MAG: winged helix-turn-helix domain-containing protein [Pseudomonadota bacterium]